MKNRSLFVLTLAGVLAVPVFAQDNSTSQTQSSTPTQTTTRQPTSQTTSETATGKQPLQPQAREGFWGRVNPFARKKYVQRQTAPIRDRVNELDELTASKIGRA